MERLQKEIDLIQSDEVRQFVILCLENCPDTFWTIAASSSGYYHPKQANEVGGLVQHTKLVVSFCVIMSRSFGLDQWQVDELIAAAILHDVHKHSKTHAIDTWKWIISTYFTDKPSYTMRIANMVKYHMGPWTIQEYCIPIEAYTTCQLVLHLADMCATNKILSWEV